jgi:hypothetical protein
MNVIQHCFIFRPSDSTVSEDPGIEPRTTATLALTVRRSNYSARSHPHFIYIYLQIEIVRKMALFRNDRVGGRVGDRRLLAHTHSPGGGHDSPEGWIQVQQIFIAQI